MVGVYVSVMVDIGLGMAQKHLITDMVSIQKKPYRILKRLEQGLERCKGSVRS